MRILFIGIFDNHEPNTAFRNALKEASSDYFEIGWNQVSNKAVLQDGIIFYAGSFKPDLVFMQLQGANIIGEAALKALRDTGAFLCQWTGDARQPLPKHYIDFGKKIDLSLFTNWDDVEVMMKNGVKADYLQVSADHNIYTPKGPVIKGVPEIVFMGNHYNTTFELSDYRFRMVKFLKDTYGNRFGVYGAGYPKGFATGNLMHNQLKEAQLYRSCKIAINCSHYDLKSYTSDRFFRILLSGTFCISKEFPEMKEYFPFENFVPSDPDFRKLKETIDYYLIHEAERKKIAQSGHEFAYIYCKWTDRINQLLKLVEKWNGQKSYQS